MSTQAPSFLTGSSSFWQVRRTTIIAWMALFFGQISSSTAELAAFKRLKNLMYNIVTTLALSCLIGSSLFL